jgi:N-methylhydantoinase B
MTCEVRNVDPVVTEIVRRGVIAVTEEMKTNLMRTAYNTIIYEALDFTTGLFTAAGETVSIGMGLPFFTRGMAETIKATVKHFGVENISPQDILVTNDAYITGSHLYHVTLTLPIFYEDMLVGFSCCMAHWIDIGGTLGNITTDIYSEGLQIPILKLYRKGVSNDDVHDFIRMNVRIPNRALGDLRAQVTAVRTGEKRFIELLKRYGRVQVLKAIAAIMDHSEALARTQTRSIPDGVYEAESFMDDDGIDIGKKVPIRVKVTIAGDQMTVDLSEIAKQVKGFYNSGVTTGYTCGEIAYKCLTTPNDYPINEGAFRSLKSIVPLGKVVSAVRPAPMRRWMTYPMTVVDTIFKALAPAIPDRVIAGHHADLLTSACHGINRNTSEFFLMNIGPLGGGWGATRDADGVSAKISINGGDTHNIPAEKIEMQAPVVVERVSLVPDSGGAGERRGGLGIERVIRARTPLTVNSVADRAHCKPWGLDGGLDGAGNSVSLRVGGRWKTDFPNAKLVIAALDTGDAYRLRSGGGGGYGSPLERSIARVAHDVRQGFVSFEAARSIYGVVIANKTFAVDEAKTRALRARMLKKLEGKRKKTAKNAGRRPRKQ